MVDEFRKNRKFSFDNNKEKNDNLSLEGEKIIDVIIERTKSEKKLIGELGINYHRLIS